MYSILDSETSSAPLEPLSSETIIVLDEAPAPLAVEDCAECDDRFLRKDITDYLTAGVGPAVDGVGNVGFGNQRFNEVVSNAFWGPWHYAMEGGAFEMRDLNNTPKGLLQARDVNGVSSGTLTLGTNTTSLDGRIENAGHTLLYGSTLFQPDVASSTVEFYQEAFHYRDIWIDTDGLIIHSNAIEGIANYIQDSSLANDYVGESFRSYGYDRLTYSNVTYATQSYTNNLLSNNMWVNKLVTSMLSFISAKAVKTQIAEYYTSDNVYPPGTVVCFGGTNEVTSDAVVGDSKIAGVVVPVNEQTFDGFDDLDELDDLLTQFDSLADMKDASGFETIRGFKDRLEELRALTQLEDLNVLELLKDIPLDQIVDNPALLMNSELASTSQLPVVAVSLRGRTKCIVSGKVRKGDVLIADGKGGAMSATVPQQAGPSIYPGAEVGKALEDSLTHLNAIIEIVVT